MGTSKTVRVLVLSATTGYQLRSFGDAAARLGVELTFATDRCHALDDPWQDDAVPVRFEDPEGSTAAVTAAARTRPIAGIVAVGDRPVVLAARVAAALGLRGHPPDAAAASANKLRARERFAAAGMIVPWHFAVTTSAGPADVAGCARYPAVVKPLSLSGSRGVIRADSPEQLVDAFTRVRTLLERPDVRAMRIDTDRTVLVEGYIAGREYAVEGLLTAGAFRALAVFDKPDPLDGPFFEETVYVTPARLARAEADLMVAEIARAVRALGLTHGAVHAECRLTADGVFVLEVAARPIGGLCSRVLRFGRSGDISLEELLLRHACGEDVSGLRREPRAAAVMMVPIPKRGIFKRVEGVEDARAVRGIEEVQITARPDQLLEPLPEAASYLGFIFARAEEAGEAERAVREAHARLTFRIDAPLPVAR
jgi:biotin carboxylase